MDLSNAVTIVTGGASGIGRACAMAFARAGARVVVVDVDGDRAGAVADEITHTGAHACAMALDVTHDDGHRRLLEFTVERFGGVDLVMNNVGVVW